ncbi:MAG: type 1 glutamine amidotransferase [Chloroflexota bacterium]|nr:MAG: glutamine amidotransferase [Chloroflexota bacterium]
MTLTLVHLYPSLLNLYGDRGNIIALRQRCAWRGIDLRVVEVGLRENVPRTEIDLIFMGGDQDREQGVVVADLRQRHIGTISRLVEEGVPFLAVCGSFQLLQNYYRTADGSELRGLGIFDAHTIHPGHHVPRCVGNIVVRLKDTTIVGFENHGGRTYLSAGVEPLGEVESGFGNNGKDGTEGARVRNAFGTYIHGSLLPKNPEFADHLLFLAMQRTAGQVQLATIDDRLEQRAHDAAVGQARSQSRPR